jgi:hypothetical protein
MNPEADLSLWHVNLYGSELKLLLLLLRRDPHPPLTATWRIVLAILASSQNFGVRKPKF